MNEIARILQHLGQDYTEPVRDPIWKHIYLSGPLWKIVQCDSFQKLNGIKQLGPTYLIYPGATHTRFSHSLGVFHVAWRMINQLIKQSTLPRLSLEGVKAFLCASLLHDLGHYPYAHSLKDLDVKEHEKITAEIILQNKNLTNLIRNELGVSPHLVVSIINSDSESQTSQEIIFFRNLLSGVLDPDKLDYLNRDAYFCGIPYGIQDIDFIFSQIYPHPEKGLSISKKGIVSVESILFAKYLMYRSVYWHKRVRVATAMIKKAIKMGLDSKAIHSNDLYEIDDQEFFRFMKSHFFPPFRLIEMAERGDLFIPAFSTPFCQENRFHRNLENMNMRLDFEVELSARISSRTGLRISPLDIIIDIPERISFEMDLPISSGEENISYLQSGSVFSKEVVQGFTRSLRTVSLLVASKENLPEKIASMKPGSLLELLAI